MLRPPLSARTYTLLPYTTLFRSQARRAHEVALAYVRKRQAFGKALGEHEGVGFMLADNELDLQSSRLSIWHTAWMLDQGSRGNLERSEEHTSELQSLMRISYAVFCLKKKKRT